MTTREKIIVGVMCLTIVYGAYELLGSRKPESRITPVQANPADGMKKFVMEVTQKLVGEKITKDSRHVISQAGAQWTKDPFLHSTALLKENRSGIVTIDKSVKKEKLPEIIYTGYMQIEETRLAILNGVEYVTGESLNVNNYYVKEIHPARVVVGRINSPETIQLPLEEVASGIAK